MWKVESVVIINVGFDCLEVQFYIGNFVKNRGYVNDLEYYSLRLVGEEFYQFQFSISLFSFLNFINFWRF